jgi:hypothetical protein
MSVFKNNPNFLLYYSDTDSIFIDDLLPESMIGKAMGQLKLEYVIKKAVFIAPKVYALILEDGTEVIKIKGLNSEAIKDEGLNFDSMSQLLNQDSSRELNQEKWFRSIKEGTITISDIAYTLKATANKRLPVFIDGVYEKTVPFYYSEIESSKDDN